MSIANHIKAAEYHEIAARAHKAVARLLGEGNIVAAETRAATASVSGESAQKLTAEAYIENASFIRT